MRIGIIPVGEVHSVVLEEVNDVLSQVFNATVASRSAVDIPSAAYVPHRDQYRVEPFVELAANLGGGDRNIAITPVDVFYDDREYVFGVAQLNGKGSLVSIYRLQRSPDGEDLVDPTTAVNRIRKEVVHEIGHAVGQKHCRDSDCVMSFSPRVGDIDKKSERYCSSCQADRRPTTFPSE